MNLALVNHVANVAPLGAPYIGGSGWGVPRASSLALWRWPAWSLTGSSYSGISGVAERRRNPSELRSWAGRQKRRHRTVLAGWDRAARRRAQQRGRGRTQ